MIGAIRAEPDGPAWRQTTFYPFAAGARSAGHTVHRRARFGLPDVTCTITRSADESELLVHLPHTALVGVDIELRPRLASTRRRRSSAEVLCHPDPHATNTATHPFDRGTAATRRRARRRLTAAEPAAPIMGEYPSGVPTERGMTVAKRSTSVTMADVGALAGVTARTVSNVLSDSPAVRPETRERVLRAVDEARLSDEHVRAQPQDRPHRSHHPRHPRPRHRLLQRPRPAHHERVRAPSVGRGHRADRRPARDRDRDPVGAFVGSTQTD